MVEYFHLKGLYNGSWLLFILVAALSRGYGKNILFKKLGVPTITGYMIIGFLCGPYVLKVLTVDQVEECGYVNKIALSFIAFSAGAEIHWHEIKPLLRSIVYVSAGMTFFTMILATIFSFGMGGTALLPWLGSSIHSHFPLIVSS
jgi:Kef-type K+ transport system membrane component KefB